MRLASAVRSIALLEAFKGAVVLLAGFGILALLHRDLHALAAALIRHAHLNPAAHYPRIFIDAANRLTDARLWLYAGGAAAYATLRFVEGWGLWRRRAWAEWLAAASGAVYVPIEIVELWRRPGLLGALVLALNLVVVVVMLRAVFGRADRRP